MPSDFLVDLLANAKSISMEDPFTFSCKKCGKLCCSSVIDILIIPSEKIRIGNDLKKKNRKRIFMDDYPNHQPFKMEIDPFAMTSAIFINPIPDPENGQPLCPFFCLSSRPGDIFGGCGVYDNRPNTCRCFPFGNYIKSAYGLMEQKFVFMPAPCPGFQGATSDQTVGEYLDKNKSPNMEMEFSLFYKYLYPKICNLVDIGGEQVSRMVGEWFFNIPIPVKVLSETELHEYILIEYARIEREMDKLLN